MHELVVLKQRLHAIDVARNIGGRRHTVSTRLMMCRRPGSNTPPSTGPYAAGWPASGTTDAATNDQAARKYSSV